MHWVAQIEGGPKRVNHAAVAVGSKIYSFGGYSTGDNLREYHSIDVHILNTKTFRWTKHPVSELPYFENDDILPFKRYGHTAVAFDEKIYIWGGRNDRASCSVLFCFDTVWHYWMAPPCVGDIPAARDGHSACVCDNKMYIFGGFEEESDSFAKAVYMLNMDTMRWHYIHTSGSEPAQRDFHTAVCIDRKMYLFGGRSVESQTGYLSTEMYCTNLWYLDLITHTWHRPVTFGEAPSGRRSHSAFVRNNKMYIFGGFNALKGEHYNDMYEFDPMTNTWTRLKPLGNAPNKRRRQASLLVNDRVFLFGGTSPKNKEQTSNNSSDSNLVDQSDLYILDFLPTLKTLCLIATHRHNLNITTLPYNIINEFKNMVSPNQIIGSRPTNSAG